MERHEIYDYCREHRVKICIENVKDCPCRILVRGTAFCDFVRHYFKYLAIEQDELGANSFLNKVCERIRNEIRYGNYLTKIAQDQKRHFLENSKIGERVYCTTKMDDVILLSKPSKNAFKCRYKTLDGEIKEEFPHRFRVISKGKNFAVIKTKNKSKALGYEISARENGFRVEKEKQGSNYGFKIYGDTQKDVDDFVELSCRKDLNISYY